MKKRIFFGIALSSLLLTSCGLNILLSNNQRPMTSMEVIDSSIESSMDSYESTSTPVSSVDSMEPVYASSFNLIPNENYIKDDIFHFRYNVEPKNARLDLDVSSSDESVIKVLKKGINPTFLCLNKGEAVIKATDMNTGLSDSIKVSVSTIAPESISILGTDNFYVGEYTDILVDASPKGASDYADITIISGAENISYSTVRETGYTVVHGIRAGTFTVKATLKDKNINGELVEMTKTYTINDAPGKITSINFGYRGISGHHEDGSSIPESYRFIEKDEELLIHNCNRVYYPAYDNAGNSCLKLGAGRASGYFSIYVPSDVNYVEFYVSGYKYHKASIKINGVQYDINTKSDFGEYTKISIDTRETKQILFETIECLEEDISPDQITTTVEKNYRVMIDKILYIR